MTEPEIYEVGGCVRDDLMGLPYNDIDYTVVAESYDQMCEWLINKGFHIWEYRPQFLTVRAKFPTTDGTGNAAPEGIFAGRYRNGLSFDFVMARKEGTYSDGRHPDDVVPGTLLDDLARRDFTVNAIARDKDGNIIDPFGGRRAIEKRVLNAVGNAEARIREDALRAIRAVRFHVTKGFMLDWELMEVMHSDWLPDLVSKVVVDRRRDELTKCFKHDTMATIGALAELPFELVDAMLNGVWLKPTTEKR